MSKQDKIQEFNRLHNGMTPEQKNKVIAHAQEKHWSSNLRDMSEADIDKYIRYARSIGVKERKTNPHIEQLRKQERVTYMHGKKPVKNKRERELNRYRINAKSMKTHKEIDSRIGFGYKGQRRERAIMHDYLHTRYRVEVTNETKGRRIK